MASLRFLTMLVWALVFLVLLLFAVKNAEPVDLRFYFDQTWQAPLIVVVLCAFGAGALFGLIACLPALVRRRREIGVLKRELRVRDNLSAVPPVQPADAAPSTPIPPAV